MAQIFGIHTINGLPSTSDTLYPNTYITKDSYDIPLIENLSNNIYNTHNQYQINIQSLSSVYIASDPIGAKIYIDNIEQTGFTTPSMITDIPSGHHNFKLTSPGHIDIESSMPLEPGKTYNVFLTMGRSTTNSTSTSSSDLILLIAIGLIGYFLIKKR